MQLRAAPSFSHNPLPALHESAQPLLALRCGVALPVSASVLLAGHVGGNILILVQPCTRARKALGVSSSGGETIIMEADMPYMFHIRCGRLIRQCCFCRLILSGPYRGHKMSLCIGDTHGICNKCLGRWRRHWRKVSA